jgi:hypothetical protein
MKELKGVKELWHTDWYDGPLAGFCEYQGKIYYYFVSGDEPREKDGKKYHRIIYSVYEVGDEEIETQKVWKALKEKFDDIPEKHKHKNIAWSYWRHFSENAYKQPDPTDDKLIGFTYFED